MKKKDFLWRNVQAGVRSKQSSGVSLTVSHLCREPVQSCFPIPSHDAWPYMCLMTVPHLSQVVLVPYNNCLPPGLEQTETKSFKGHTIEAQILV